MTSIQPNPCLPAGGKDKVSVSSAGALWVQTWPKFSKRLCFAPQEDPFISPADRKLARYLYRMLGTHD